MKEQIGVDMAVGESETVEGVYMIKSEYDRLKRLDENVKKKIASYKECVNGKFGDDYQELINIIEGLYK